MKQIHYYEANPDQNILLPCSLLLLEVFLGNTADSSFLGNS